MRIVSTGPGAHRRIEPYFRRRKRWRCRLRCRQTQGRYRAGSLPTTKAAAPWPIPT